MAPTLLEIMPKGAKRAVSLVLPLIIIVFARIMTFSDWAEANASLAALLFGWLVVDSLLLSLLARAPAHRPSLYQLLGVVSLSGIVLLVSAASEVRAVYLGMTQFVAAFCLTLALFLIWSVLRFARTLSTTRSWRSAAETIMPPLLVNLLVAEIRILDLALFRWRVAPDVPDGWRPFSYHTYLVPMIATFLAMQLIELAVVHFLILLWNPLLAWILFGVSTWGVIWTIAQLKSFRINPVLLGEDAIRVRSGMIHDVYVPRAALSEWGRAFTASELKSKDILNLALLASPNVHLRLAEPVEIATITGGTRNIRGIALRLEESAEFLAELRREGTLAED